MTQLGALTWPEVEALRDRVLIVPLGSTEQHGPHLPLSTDTDIAVALASRVAAARDDVVVAPAVPYGASGEHAGFAGTLSIGTAALSLLLLELGRSARASFDRLLLLNAHGGNADAVQAAAERLQLEGVDVQSFSPSWGGDAHAGATETSLQLALRPAAVRTELMAPGATAPLRELLPRLQAHGVLAVSPNGVLGDPTGACALDGEALLRTGVAQLCSVLDAWASR